MKRIIILVFLVFFLVSCDNNTENTSPVSGEIIQELQDLKLQPRVIFVWNNPINWAYYNAYFSCTNWSPQGFESIPDDQTVEIILLDDCKTNKIPSEVLDIMTKKKFRYVYLFLEFYITNDINDHPTYDISDEEVLKIAKAPWKTLAISWLKKEQYRILRNTPNPVHELFEPTGDTNFYTPEEQEKCNIFWKELSPFEEDKVKIETVSNKVISCYKSLSPLP